MPASTARFSIVLHTARRNCRRMLLCCMWRPCEQPDAASCRFGNFATGHCESVWVRVVCLHCDCCLHLSQCSDIERNNSEVAIIVLLTQSGNFLQCSKIWINSWPLLLTLSYTPHALLILIDCRHSPFTFAFSFTVNSNSALLRDCYRAIAAGDSFVGHLLIAAHWLGANTD